MIKFGFNTLAMLTFGLGIALPWVYRTVIRRPERVQFRDKPPGITVEEKTGPTSFEDETFDFRDRRIEFEDR